MLALVWEFEFEFVLSLEPDFGSQHGPGLPAPISVKTAAMMLKVQGKALHPIV